MIKLALEDNKTLQLALIPVYPTPEVMDMAAKSRVDSPEIDFGDLLKIHMVLQVQIAEVNTGKVLESVRLTMEEALNHQLEISALCSNTKDLTEKVTAKFMQIFNRQQEKR